MCFNRCWCHASTSWYRRTPIVYQSSFQCRPVYCQVRCNKQVAARQTGNYCRPWRHGKVWLIEVHPVEKECWKIRQTTHTSDFLSRYAGNEMSDSIYLIVKDGVSEGQFQQVLDYGMSYKSSWTNKNSFTTAAVQNSLPLKVRPPCPEGWQRIHVPEQTLAKPWKLTRKSPSSLLASVIIFGGQNGVISTRLKFNDATARMFPHNPRDADRSGNCPAGTTIDNGLGHPTEFDYYQLTHGGLIGTSRPAHYSVRLSVHVQTNVADVYFSGYLRCRFHPSWSLTTAQAFPTIV